MGEFITAAEAATKLEKHLDKLAAGWRQQRPDLHRRLINALADEPNQLLTQMSYEEFLDWLDEDTRAEWEDGKVVLMSPASIYHERIFSLLFRLLTEYVEQHELGEVIAAPFQMKLARIRRGREPDLMFVTTANLSRVLATHVDGPADLVIEIVSPESVARDRVVKFQEYAEAGISEYWVVDPLEQRVEFFTLDSNGSYSLIAPDADGRYHSYVLPAFWLRSAWLWQQKSPRITALLSEIGAM